MSLNKIIIQGNVANEIELKSTNLGTSVCSFSVAVNRFTKDPEQAKADFFTVVAWQGKAELIAKHWSKGKPILICGRLENRAWEDKNGNKRVSAEIIVEEVSFVGGGTENATEAKSKAPTASQTYLPGAFGGKQTSFEEIPTDESLPF